MTELIPYPQPADDLAGAVRRFLTDMPRPEPDPVTVLELALLRQELRELPRLRAEVTRLQYALADADVARDGLELELTTWGTASEAHRTQIATLQEEAQRRELHIVELSGNLEATRELLGQARARIAELEDTLTRRLEEIDQLGRRLAEALDERAKPQPPAGDYATGYEHGLAEGYQKALRERESPANGPKASTQVAALAATMATPERTARVVMAGSANALHPCPYCGKDDFTRGAGRGAHISACPSNPDRRKPGPKPKTGIALPRPTTPPAPPKPPQRPAPASSQRNLAQTVVLDGPYLCPECNEAAFAKSPAGDMCIRCMAAKRAA